jgi:hypothetical protein
MGKHSRDETILAGLFRCLFLAVPMMYCATMVFTFTSPHGRRPRDARAKMCLFAVSAA